MGRQGLSAAQGWGSGRADREFRLLCSSKNVQHSNRFSWSQRHDRVLHTSQWSPQRSGARVLNFARSSKTRSMESFQLCRKLETLARRARGIVGRTVVNPPAHRHMTRKCLLDVFGGPGYVLDTKFGPRYDVTKPFVLTRIRQDVSAGKCVAGMTSTSTTTHFVLSQSHFHQCCHRKLASPCSHALDFVEHPCDSWLWDVPKIQALAAQPRTFLALSDFCFVGSPSRERTLLLVGHADNKDVHRIARRCASVSGQKHVHPKASASRPLTHSSHDHTRFHRLSFALAMILSMNARRFQRTHHF